MKRIIFFLALLCVSLSASAHQPDLSSTILAEKGENEWVLQVRAALTAFEYEVKARFGESAFTTPEEFRERVASYLQDELTVRFNGETAMALSNGVVSLGHETTVTFKLTGVPAEVNTVAIRNQGFENIRNNQSVLYVAIEGFTRKQFMLNDDNGHAAALMVSGNSFAIDESAEVPWYLLPVLLLTALVLGISGMAVYYHWHFVPQVTNQVLAANDITEISCTLVTQTDSAELFGFAKDGFPIYAYAEEPIDLDECGGRTAATTEFPDGTYHYVASTTNAANVPVCLKGLVASNPFRLE